MKENKDVLDQVKGNVKLGRRVTIKPYDSGEVSGVTHVGTHTKRLNVLTEGCEDLDGYTLPSYSCMRPGSNRMGVTLMNLSSRPVTLRKGTIVATIKAANNYTHVSS